MKKIKKIKDLDLSKVSSEDLAYELYCREDVILIQWFSKSHLRDILKDSDPTEEEIDAYLNYLKKTTPYMDRISSDVREDFDDFINDPENEIFFCD